MSRPSAKKHVIADIRLKCGLTQPQLAKLLGVAGISLQRVEQGTLRMSEEMAAKAEKQLDVSGAYLLANDPTQAPVTPRGGLWNVEHYEFSQGSISHVKEVKH